MTQFYERVLWILHNFCPQVSGLSPQAVSGEITLTTGTGALSAGTLVTATFSGVTRANPPNCLITQQGGSTAISTYAKSATSTVLTISGLATASQTYILDYGCGGN
jgi:hypothetical protein